MGRVVAGRETATSIMRDEGEAVGSAAHQSPRFSQTVLISRTSRVAGMLARSAPGTSTGRPVKRKRPCRTSTPEFKGEAVRP